MTIDGGTGTDIADLIEGTVTLDSTARFAGVERLDVLITALAGTSGSDLLDLRAFATMAFGAALGLVIRGGQGNDTRAGAPVTPSPGAISQPAGILVYPETKPKRSRV